MKNRRVKGILAAVAVWIALPGVARAHAQAPDAGAKPRACPQLNPEGERQLAQEWVRLVASGFGPGMGTDSACLDPARFRFLKIPRSGTEAGDGAARPGDGAARPGDGAARPGDSIGPSDRFPILKLEPSQASPTSRQIEVRFEVQRADGSRIQDSLTYLRSLTPKAQAELGCALILAYPKHRFVPLPGHCP